MRLWKLPPNNGYADHLEPAGIYKVLAKLHMVWVIRWLEYHRYRKAFKGQGTVSREADGSIVINIGG